MVSELTVMADPRLSKDFTHPPSAFCVYEEQKKNAVLWDVAPTFRRNVSPPSSRYKNPRARNQREQVAKNLKYYIALFSSSF
jgi:hypothetical protein